MSLLHHFSILVWTGYWAELWTKVTVEDLSPTPRSLIFAELLEVLMMALEALHEETKPLGLQVSWPKTKVQVFRGLLNETVYSCVWRGH